MVSLTCHCGAVRVEVAQAPAEVTDCNCSICRRYGTLWAYYAPKRVRFIAAVPPTDQYLWGDRDLEFHRCRCCGCITHWSPADKTRDRMGVNMRLADPEIVEAARIRRLDGADTWAKLKD